MRATRWMVLGLSCCLLLSGGAIAADGSKGGGNKAPAAREASREQAPFREVLARLNLSADQKKQVHQILEDQRQAFHKYRQEHEAEFKKAMADLKAARESKDEAKLKAAREELRKLYEAGPNLKQMAEKIRGVLTADQQKTFDDEMEKVRQRVREQAGGGKLAARRNQKQN